MSRSQNDKTLFALLVREMLYKAYHIHYLIYLGLTTKFCGIIFAYK